MTVTAASAHAPDLADDVFVLHARSLRCPHCGEVYATKHIAHIPEKTLPNTLWT